MNETEYIKSVMTKQRDSSMFKSQGFLSSGSTLLNLACTGTVGGAWPVGYYSLLIGDSRAGKTWLGLSSFAEAAQDSRFDDYYFCYDGPEGGALMDIEKYFGKKAADRIEAPNYDDDGLPLPSTSVEEFYFNIHDILDEKEKVIYVLDSMDCLTSRVETEKFESMKKAHDKGTESKGVMTDGKAKANSAGLRNVIPKLQKTGSVLLILVQTRDSFSMFDPKTHAGGRALRFYCVLEVWAAITGQLKKTVKKKQRQIGVNTRLRLKKNRITGKEKSVEIPILHSGGIDDVSSCIDFLVEEGIWKKKGKTISVGDFVGGVSGSIGSLVRKIEEEGLENKLQRLVGETWVEIEKACESRRKRRYD